MSNPWTPRTSGVICQPIPTPGGAGNPDIWDARVAPLSAINYFTNANPTNTSLRGVSPNDANFPNRGSVQAGMTNPLNDAVTNYRVMFLASFGTIAARPMWVTRYRNWSTDTNNKNVGQLLHPACSDASAFDLGVYPNGNWDIWVGFSVGFPSGAGANGFPAGDTAFPPNIRGFMQVYEDFGKPFGSPVWSLQINSGGWIYGGAPTRPDLSGSTNNYLVMQTGAGAMWVDTNPLVLDAWYDFEFHIQRSTIASPDGGLNGGLLEVFENGVQQVFLPGATEGGYSGADWTRINAGETMLVATLNSGDSGAGYSNLDLYRTVTSPTEPVTMYRYGVGVGSARALITPSTH